MSSSQHLIMLMSKREFTTPGPVMEALYPTLQMESDFSHKTIFLTTNQFRVLSLSRVSFNP